MVGGGESASGSFGSFKNFSSLPVLPHSRGKDLVQWYGSCKRTHTCLRQVCGSLTHVARADEGDGTPPRVLCLIRLVSLIASSRLCAV